VVAAVRQRRRSVSLRSIVAAVAVLGALFPPAAAGAVAPGSPDPSFGSHGLTSIGSNTRLFGTGVQSDGKVVAVGQSVGSNLIVARFTTSGALDSSFGGGVVTGPATGAPVSGSIGRAVAIQPDGKIVAVGSSGSGSGGVGLLVERFNANGSPDSSFGKGGAVNLLTSSLADGYSVAIQPDGKILAGGAADETGSDGYEPRVVVVRLNSNGSLDSTFGSGGVDVLDLGPISAARGLALAPGGKIAIAGSIQVGLQVPEGYVARLTSSGALDTGFHGTGYYTQQFSRAGANSVFYSVAVQSDGKIVAGGAAVNGTTGADAVVARFTSSGSLDSSFGSGGVAYMSSGVNSPPGSAGEPGIRGIVLAGGDVVAAGYSTNGPYSSGMLWALTSGGALDGRFGSGGMAVANFGSDRFNEFSGLGLAPNGELAAVGDTQPTYEGGYTGIAALYGGFGPVSVPALTVSLKGVSGKYKTATVAKHGLKLGVNCNEACSVQVSLVLSAGTARKLHIVSTFKKCTKVHGKRKCKTVHGYKAVTIASGSGSLGGSGTKTITLHLIGRYVKTLKAQKQFGVKLSASAVSSATHKSKTVSKSLTFKR
jgi:uncharacterized delta-60 repeat protein